MPSILLRITTQTLELIDQQARVLTTMQSNYNSYNLHLQVNRLCSLVLLVQERQLVCAELCRNSLLPVELAYSKLMGTNIYVIELPVLSLSHLLAGQYQIFARL